MSITPVKRSKLIHLINTKVNWETTGSDSFNLVNEGVTELTEDFNADTDDIQYIAEDQATSIVKRYAPAITLSAVMVDGSDPVNTWIQKIINKLPIGKDADTEYIRFSLLDVATAPSEETANDKIKYYKAIKKKAVVSVGSIGGSAGDNVEMEVTLSGKGDPIDGIIKVDASLDTITYTFTANSTSAAAPSNHSLNDNDYSLR